LRPLSHTKANPQSSRLNTALIITPVTSRYQGKTKNILMYANHILCQVRLLKFLMFTYLSFYLKSEHIPGSMFLLLILLQLTSRVVSFQKENIDETFVNCHIISVDTAEHLALDAIRTATTRLKYTGELYSNAIETLKNRFKSNKLKCQVIYFLLSSNNYNWKILKSFSWLNRCDGSCHLSPCYERNTYWIGTARQAATEYAIPRPPLLYVYYPPSHHSAAQLSIMLSHPCLVTRTGDLNLATNRGVGSITRVKLDELYRESLQSCSVSWEFLMNRPYESYPVTVFTGSIPKKLKSYTKLYLKFQHGRKDATHLLAMAVSPLNNSQTDSNYWYRQRSVIVDDNESYQIVYINKDMYPGPHMTGVGDTNKDMYIFFPQQTHYNFITCDGSFSFLSFRCFWLPFKPHLWLTLSVSFAFLLMFLKLAFRHLKLSDSSLLILYSIVLDQNVCICTGKRKICGLKYCFASVLLTTLILTNLYRGSLTSDLTASIPTFKLKFVDEAVGKGYKVLVPVVNQSSLHYHYVNNPELFPEFKNVKEERDWKLYIVAYSHNFIAALINSLQKIGKQSYQKLYHNIDIQLEINYSIEHHLILCNKTMYMGSPNELDEMLQAIDRVGPTRIFYKGMDEYLTHPLAWVFTGMSFDRLHVVHKGFQAVIHSGIFELFHRSDVASEQIVGSALKALSTDSGFIISTLVIYFSLLLVCFVVLVVELTQNLAVINCYLN